MKQRITLALAVLAALVAVTAAWAATPQGKLTGGADVAMTALGIERIVINTTVQDGEQVYVNLNNDRSGAWSGGTAASDCDGDNGDLNLTYTGGHDVTVPVLCAHYSNGTSKTGNFSLVIADPVTAGQYDVLRFLDRGQNAGGDKVEYSYTTSLAAAIAASNLGVAGCGQCIPVQTQVAATNGNYQAAQ